MARGKSSVITKHLVSVTQDFTIESYSIYYLLNSEFPEPDPVSVPILTIPLAQKSQGSENTSFLGNILYYSKGNTSLTVQHESQA